MQETLVQAGLQINIDKSDFFLSQPTSRVAWFDGELNRHSLYNHFSSFLVATVREGGSWGVGPYSPQTPVHVVLRRCFFLLNLNSGIAQVFIAEIAYCSI